MLESKKDKVINPTSHIKPSTSTFALKELALKYYNQLETIVNDLAEKTTGGEEAKLVFPMGSVTIKLK